VIISYSRKLVFVHIHKTGGDSITAALLPMLFRSDIVLKNDLQAWLQKLRLGRSHPELAALRKHSPAVAIAQVVPAEFWASSFKFAFTRHPIGRTVSLYKFALRKARERRRFVPRNAWYLSPPGRRTDPLHWHSVEAFLDTESFSDFIRHPLLQNDLTMRPQWHSVSDGTGRMLVDFVGRFERLQEDFHEVQDHLGLPRTTLEWRNSSRDVIAATIKITTEDREYLADRFRVDFDHFGYDPSIDS